MKRITTIFLAAILAAVFAFPVFAQTNPTISQGRAIEIARSFLATSGFPEGDLMHAFTIVRNNRLVWDVEFWSGNTEYEFYIDAFSGEIVGFEMELNERPQLPQGMAHGTGPHWGPNNQQVQLAISPARAHQIATEVIGGGTVRQSGLGFYQGHSVHQLEVDFGASRFQVFVTTDTGQVVRLRVRR